MKKPITLDDGTVMILRYVYQDIDRHGNLRTYARHLGRKLRIRETANPEEFMPAYRAALEAVPAVPEVAKDAVRVTLVRWPYT